MRYLLRLLPGLIAALFAFVSLRIAATLGLDGLIPQLCLFLGMYMVIVVIADRAMADYGKGSENY